MGERVALWSQTVEHGLGKLVCHHPRPLRPPKCKDANEGEEASRGVGVDLGLALEPVLQDARALVVDAGGGPVSIASILEGGMVLTAGVVAFADLPVIL